MMSKPRLSLQALRGKGKGGEGHIKHQDHDHSGEPRGSSIGRRRRASSMSAKANRLVSCLKGNALTLATVSGVLSGIALGFILRASREESWTPREIMYVSYVGEIFLRSLRCLILPLIVSSIISAVGGLELGMSSRIAFRAVVYYMTTTILAVILGIILVTSIHPGVAGAQDVPREGEARNVTTADTLMDLIR
ncbi:unnamed protein product [Darwinula stevensoni]|uniref:Amino acid transporter n=1 Tax=Darwinula stevensoni TaxID=69355 RepID=A0A7R9FQ66_9CRUS|nr:unnamed protein product [Darwinula stevensoni]CAG0898858.1 unnamed protein product [Darwinula stevensoni]